MFAKHSTTKTTWEALYAVREGRKYVKMTFQGQVYNFLERPRGWKCITYHCSVLITVLTCLTLSVMSTVDNYARTSARILFYMEIIIVSFFGMEYIARLWAAGCRSKYMGFAGRLRYVTRPIAIIDFIIIVASLVVLVFGSNGQVFATSAIRGIRFLQILRMLHVDRQGGTWRLLGSVVYMHRQELLTTLYIGFLGLIFSSYLLYLAEKDVVNSDGSSDFGSYADSLWWGVVTMMTIGYGDKVPVTWLGRVLACISAIFTVSFFALPSGILGSGFALKVQQQQRQKHFSRQIPAAATLIQCLWRCHAADKGSHFSATWEIHLNHRHNRIMSSPFKFRKPGGALRHRRPKSRPEIVLTLADGLKENLNGLQFKSSDITLDLGKPNRHNLHHSRSVPDMQTELTTSQVHLVNKENNDADEGNDLTLSTSLTDLQSDDPETPEPQRFTKLTEAHKNAVRAIRKIKFFVARRKFQQARRPYDVGDIIEQYSQGQLNMMVRIRELQRRLDQSLGKPGYYLTGKASKPVTIGTQLQQMEHQLNKVERKLDAVLASLQQLAINTQQIQDKT